MSSANVEHIRSFSQEDAVDIVENLLVVLFRFSLLGLNLSLALLLGLYHVISLELYAL